MYQEHRISVVVPCHNEEANVLSALQAVPEYVDDVIVVDDGSTDRTWEVISRIDDPRIFRVRHERNLGVGAAIVSGHKRAIELESDISVVMAGDNQMDVQFLPSLLSAITERGYDYAKGNRFLRHGHLKGMPRYRVAGNIALTFLTKFASGYWNIFDPQNGFTAVRTSILKEIELDHLDKGYNFENDMLVHLNIIGASVVDVPCSISYGNKASGIKPLRFMGRSVGFLFSRFFYRLVKKYFLYDFGAYPILFLPGLVLFLLGLAYGVQVVYLRYLSPVRETASTGTIILAGISLVLGLQLLLTAFIFEAIQTPRPSRRSDDW